MAILINNDLILEDPWKIYTDYSEHVFEYPDFSVLPVQAFHPTHSYRKRSPYLGAWCDISSDLALFQSQVLSLPLLNIVVQDFNDGRVFTLAKKIREHFKYDGELRLSGAFLIEQVAMFSACGVSSFSLKDESDYEYALYLLKNTPLPSY